MILGALVDAGLSITDVERELSKIDLNGFSFRLDSANQHGLTGTFLDVNVTGEQPSRNWTDIRALIEASTLSDNVKSRALSVFGRLAEAEAKVHGTTPDDVH